jgi:hypothetical protein
MERAMIEDLDGALRRLAAGPAHPGLATMDGAVLERARAVRGPSAGVGYALAMLATLSAGGLGLVAAGGQPTPRVALAPLGDISPLAPSSLLASVE